MFLLNAATWIIPTLLIFALPPRWALAMIALTWASLLALLFAATDGRGIFFLAFAVGPFGICYFVIGLVRAAYLLRRSLTAVSYRSAD